MLNPTQTLFRWWGPCVAAAFAPLVLLAVFPALTGSALGWLALIGTAAAAAFSAAAVLSRGLRETVERVAEDLEALGRGEGELSSGSVRWGLLSDLSGGFAWLCERQRTLLDETQRGGREQAARLQVLGEVLREGVVLANLRGEVLLLNRPAAEFLGLQGETPRLLTDLKLPEPLRLGLEHVLDGRSRMERADFDVERGAERRRRVEAGVSLASAADGREVGLVIVMRDASLEREFAEMKEDFFLGVAHDLKGPLFGIQGYTRMLERAAKLDEKERGYVLKVYESCVRLARLVEDVTDFARLDSPQPPLERAAVTAAALMEKVQGLSVAPAEAKSLRVELRGPSEEPEAFSADERLLSKALRTAVLQAIQQAPRGSEIALEWGAAGPRELEFRVQAPGPQATRESLEVLFEKFRGADAAGGPAAHGLGLPLARLAVQAHGGKLWGEPLAEGGVRFVLRVPRS